MQLPHKHFSTAVFGVVWLVAVAFGLRVLLNYEATPGRVGAVSQTWRADARIERAIDHPTLVMFAHPRCPCTWASINELAKIMAQVQGQVRAYVLFVEPKTAGAHWDDTSLRRSAAAIPGVTVAADVGGNEARRFGAETSGHTLLFDRNGRLLFSGGITQSRGHAGDNVGESAVVSLVSNHQAERRQTLVFGCALSKRPLAGRSIPCLK